MTPDNARIDEAFVQECVSRVLSVCSPDRILLFGSAASGDWTADSDVDLLVLKSELEDPRGEANQIRAALRGLGRRFEVEPGRCVRLPAGGFDVVVMTTQRFEDTKDVIGGLARSRIGRGLLVLFGFHGRSLVSSIRLPAALSR